MRALEVRKETARKDVEARLRNCPRVLNIFGTPGKANIHVIMWAEDGQTINSTLESFRDLENVDIIQIHYLETLTCGNMIINVVPRNKDKPSCGMKCDDCYRYDPAWCLGSSASKHYKNPITQ